MFGIRNSKFIISNAPRIRYALFDDLAVMLCDFPPHCVSTTADIQVPTLRSEIFFFLLEVIKNLNRFNRKQGGPTTKTM